MINNLSPGINRISDILLKIRLGTPWHSMVVFEQTLRFSTGTGVQYQAVKTNTVLHNLLPASMV